MRSIRLPLISFILICTITSGFIQAQNAFYIDSRKPRCTIPISITIPLTAHASCTSIRPWRSSLASRLSGTTSLFWTGPFPKSAAGNGNPGLIYFVPGKESDYHPAVDSPLRGAGINLSPHYKTDFEDNPLPGEGPWNVGAL